MKYFLIFSLLPFFAVSQVTIPDETARWFLERNERVKQLEHENLILLDLINTLEKKVAVKDDIINTYVTDQTDYMKVIETLRKQVSENQDMIKTLNKQIKRYKVANKIGIYAGIAGVIIGFFAGASL